MHDGAPCARPRENDWASPTRRLPSAEAMSFIHSSDHSPSGDEAYARVTGLASIGELSQTPLMRMAAAFVSCAIAAFCVAATGAAQARDVSFDDQARAFVVEAGYTLETASLIAALRDPRAALFAAAVLGQMPQTPATVSALVDAIEYDNAVVAAVRALARLGASGWEDRAAARLQDLDVPQMFDVTQTLACVGRADGWGGVRKVLSMDTFALSAGVRVLPYFHGLKDERGASIDALAILDGLRSREAPFVGDPSPAYDESIRKEVARVSDDLRRRVPANALHSRPQMRCW